MAPVCKLPPEVIIQILSLLPTRALCTASLVQRAWKLPAQELLPRDVYLRDEPAAKLFLQYWSLLKGGSERCARDLHLNNLRISDSTIADLITLARPTRGFFVSDFSELDLHVFQLPGLQGDAFFLGRLRSGMKRALQI